MRCRVESRMMAEADFTLTVRKWHAPCSREGGSFNFLFVRDRGLEARPL